MLDSFSGGTSGYLGTRGDSFSSGTSGDSGGLLYSCGTLFRWTLFWGISEDSGDFRELQGTQGTSDFFIAGGHFFTGLFFCGDHRGLGDLGGLFLARDLRGLWRTRGDCFTVGGLFFIGLCFGGNSGDSGDSGDLRGLQGTSWDLRGPWGPQLM